jgi:charged multivesicular body protein 1
MYASASFTLCFACAGQVAEEHGLELAAGLPNAAQGAKPTAAKEDDLTARLAELRGR